MIDQIEFASARNGECANHPDFAFAKPNLVDDISVSD
jgi:hypothetical protein